MEKYSPVVGMLAQSGELNRYVTRKFAARPRSGSSYREEQPVAKKQDFEK
jgi:hypothetical protein